MPVKKTKTKKETKTKVKPKPKAKKEHYFEAIGRRKTAVARVRLQVQGSKEILINDKTLEKYFPVLEWQQIVQESLSQADSLNKFKVMVKAKGGGLHGQAEAVRHGIARALVKFDPELRQRLKKAGFLTRDSRMRERKKPGLKRARRAPQWKKR